MKLPEIAADIAGVLGGLALSYGAWLVYHPAGFIAAGTLLLAGAVLYSREGA